jgi:hypothetical protein
MLTPTRLAWLVMTIGITVAAVLNAGFDVPHWAALSCGAAVAGALGLAASADAYVTNRKP